MNAKVFGLYESILKSGKLAWWDVRQKKALLNEIRKLMAPTENRWNFRWVILALIVLAFAVPGYAFWQLARGGPSDQLPPELLTLGATAVGALAGFLRPTRENGDSSNQDPPDPPTGGNP